mgnify:CR=1 FL=1
MNAEEELFLKRTNLAIGLAALAGMLAAVVIGYLLAGRLIKPIRRLTSASQELARGELQQQLPVTSQDELGLLTETFNKMSSDLFEADQKRKRLTADITHDLSTPLQVISGYMEMLEEGEVTLTPERIEIIKTEIDHLRRLVGDLSTLTQVEANGLDIQLQPVQPSVLLERIFHSYQPIATRQGVELVVEAHPTSSAIARPACFPPLRDVYADWYLRGRLSAADHHRGDGEPGGPHRGPAGHVGDRVGADLAQVPEVLALRGGLAHGEDGRGGGDGVGDPDDRLLRDAGVADADRGEDRRDQEKHPGLERFHAYCN